MLYFDDLVLTDRFNKEKKVLIARVFPANLPLRYRSIAKNWWTILGYPRVHITNINEIIEPIVEELKQLESEGGRFF